MILFGYTLENLRRRKNISLAALSEAVGIGVTTLENLESGYIEPDADAAKRIADYFGVTVGYMKGSIDIVLDDDASPKAGAPERIVKLRPVSARLFEGETLRQDTPCRDILLPLPGGDRHNYIAVLWSDNSMTRYRIEAGDILVVREYSGEIRSGDMVLFCDPTKKVMLRRYWREGNTVTLRSDADDLLLPIRMKLPDSQYTIIGVVTEILIKVNDDFLYRHFQNPPLPSVERPDIAPPESENMNLYSFPLGDGSERL